MLLSDDVRDTLEAALTEEAVERGRLIVSFLHTPSARTGCVGADRYDGFFYLDWQGHVQRCVYRPETLIDAGGRLESSETVDELIAAAARLAPCDMECLRTT